MNKREEMQRLVQDTLNDSTATRTQIEAAIEAQTDLLESLERRLTLEKRDLAALNRQLKRSK